MSHDGGSKNLAALTAYWDALPQDEQTADLRAELIRVVSHHGGSQNLAAFLRYANRLVKAYHFDRSYIIKLTACSGGAQKLFALYNSVSTISGEASNERLVHSLDNLFAEDDWFNGFLADRQLTDEWMNLLDDQEASDNTEGAAFSASVMAQGGIFSTHSDQGLSPSNDQQREYSRQSSHP